MPGIQELLAHLVGDYVVQSDWMATRKTSSWTPALCHALAYTSIFALFFGLRAGPLLVIGVTHLFIDRFRVARFVIQFKNWLLSPPSRRPAQVNPNTGYPVDTPPWMAVWLFIIVDNTMHLLINHAALAWWPQG